MPTYDYKCRECGHEDAVFQSIGEYCRAPQIPKCYFIECGPHSMERKLSVVPGMSGLANSLAGDRHYDGLQASDGTPIDTRSKHRDYMKSKGLTMAEDFKGTWESAAKERQAIRSAESLRDRKLDVRETVERAIQN